VHAVVAYSIVVISYIYRLYTAFMVSRTNYILGLPVQLEEIQYCCHMKDWNLHVNRQSSDVSD